MKKQKIFAVVMAAAMTLSLTACGEEQTNNEITPTAAPTEAAAPTETPVPTEAPKNVTIENASITFEDGNYGFADAYMQHARSANVEVSIADFNGSKALKVVNTTGSSKAPFVAIDATSFLGADVSKVAGVEMVIGISYDDGSFHAVSGEISSWWGADDSKNTLGNWSVYTEKKNPKVVTATVPAGNEFVADAHNIIYVGLTTDNGATDTGACANLYIDDIRFFDAAGNTLTGDTTVAFNWPETSGPDLSNLYLVNNAVSFEGFTTSGAGWGQNGFEMPQEIIDALVPGSVLEIAYSSEDGNMWVVMPDAAVGWTRVGDGNNGASYRNNSNNVAQITYEQLAQFCGEDKSTWGARLQCEAGTAWEVYSVKVGTAARRVDAVNAVEFPDFVTSGAGWGQNGFDIPQEIMDALVPGSVLEISYASEDGNMWIVMPDAAVGWTRVGDGNNGKSICENGICYVPYEMIVQYCGEDKSTWGARLQCEAGTAWEVYRVRVGQGPVATETTGATETPKAETPALPETVITAADGKGTVAAADASWWTQIALTKEQLFAGVAEENVTGFKFTGDTDFIIAYNNRNEDEATRWTQKDAASSFELTAEDVNFADDIYYFCFVLAKGDSVVYNLAWEVLTNGETAAN